MIEVRFLPQSLTYEVKGKKRIFMNWTSPPKIKTLTKKQHSIYSKNT